MHRRMKNRALGSFILKKYDKNAQKIDVNQVSDKTEN